MIKKCFYLFLMSFFVRNAQAQFWKPKVDVLAQNICTDCYLGAQRLFEAIRPSQPANSILGLVKSFPGSNSLANSVDQTEKRAFEILKARTKNKSVFGRHLVNAANEIQNVRYKLYYQMALNTNGQTSLFAGRNRPTYVSEREIPHELWGFYFTQDQSAYVLLNEYQNTWNADYTLVHELFHLFDKQSAAYSQFVESQSFVWNDLDNLALEFRAVLAEVQYRVDVTKMPGFSDDIMLHDDFRDKLIENGKPNQNKILGYILDVFYPVKFKKNVTKVLSNLNPGNERFSEVAFSFTAVEEFFRSFLSGEKTQVLPLFYNEVPSQTLIYQNQSKRQAIEQEAIRRGAKNIFDYLARAKLTEAVDSESVRTDGHFNETLKRTGGPSPRTGGGGP